MSSIPSIHHALVVNAEQTEWEVKEQALFKFDYLLVRVHAVIPIRLIGSTSVLINLDTPVAQTLQVSSRMARGNSKRETEWLGLLEEATCKITMEPSQVILQ